MNMFYSLLSCVARAMVSLEVPKLLFAGTQNPKLVLLGGCLLAQLRIFPPALSETVTVKGAVCSAVALFGCVASFSIACHSFPLGTYTYSSRNQKMPHASKRGGLFEFGHPTVCENFWGSGGGGGR